MKKIILVIVTVFLLTSVTACTYNPPEDASNDFHSYNEIVEYAKTLDSNAVVSGSYTETKLEGVMASDYREWDAVINGVECHVASVPIIVFNSGVMGGEFANEYFMINNDYDYHILDDIIQKSNFEWQITNLEYDNSYSIATRYLDNYYISPLNLEKRKLSFDEINEICLIVNEIYDKYEQKAISKKLILQLYEPDIFYSGYLEQYIMIKRSSFDYKNVTKAYEEYEEGWDLLNSGLPFKD